MSQLKVNSIIPVGGVASGGGGGGIQTIHKDYRTFFSTTALIPLDDTIPQNTEGAEVFTPAITPTSTSNFLPFLFLRPRVWHPPLSRVYQKAFQSGSLG